MFRLPPLTPLVRGYLIALVVLFVALSVLEGVTELSLTSLLVLQPAMLSWWLTPIQVLTHLWVVQPTQMGAISLLIGCLFLWWLVAPFEARYGKQRVLELTLVAAIADAIPVLLVGLLLPNFATPAGGPSPIGLCVICAQAARMPSTAQVSVFGLPPWTFKQLLLALVAINAIFAIPSRDLSGFLSTLSAIGAGVLYGQRWLERSTSPSKRSSPRRGGPKLRIVRSSDDDSGPRRWLN